MTTFEFLIESDAASPNIFPVLPVPGSSAVPVATHITFQLRDDVAVAIDLYTLEIWVDGIHYFDGYLRHPLPPPPRGGEGGGPRPTRSGELNGAVVVLTAVTGGYDVDVTLPSPLTRGSTHTVRVAVANEFGLANDLSYGFSTGVMPRILSITNPKEGVLLVRFNMAMRQDQALFDIGNWTLDPVSEGAAEMAITEATSALGHPDTVLLRYEGGGSRYSLGITGVFSEDGTELEPGFNSFEFEIVFGTGSPTTVKLFDSIYGPLGVSQRDLARRTVEGHTASRCIAVATNEQMKLRLAGAKNGGVVNDTRLGVNR